MKFSNSLVYALQALIALAEHGQSAPVSSRVLADRDGMPERFLLQVLRKLVAHGLLHSSFGATGGYYLARPAHSITLLEVFDVFESPPAYLSIPVFSGMPSATEKLLQACLNESVDAARQRLSGLALADLAKLSPLINMPLRGLALSSSQEV